MSEDKSFVIVVGAVALSFLLLFGGLILDSHLQGIRKFETFQSCILSRGIWVDTRGTGTCIIVEQMYRE
jgi:hypothetical protein